MKVRHLRFLGLLAVLTLAVGRDAWAQEPVDARWAIPVFLRIISLDASFDERPQESFVVLVPSPPAQADARKKVMEAVESLNVTSIKNKPLKFIEGEFSDKASLTRVVKGTETAAILVLELAKAELAMIGDIGSERKLYTMALHDDITAHRLLLGVGVSGDFRKVLVNSKVTGTLGVKFEEMVFKFVKVVP
jgi:hypothetical protein